MNDVDTDAAGRLWWAIKRSLPLLLLVVATAGTLGALEGPSLLGQGPSPVYEARSLVVASRLEIEPELLPKTAVAIFEGGAVAQRVVDIARIDRSPGDLIPDVVEVEPVENSVVLSVVGRDPDPQRAARLSIIAAEALVAELNRPGGIFGRFLVQERATPPVEAEDSLGSLAGAVLGSVAGLAFALGAVGLYVALRRPIISAAEVGAIAGSPVLGVPHLPRRGRLDPTRVSGLSVLLKRLFPSRSETVVFVGVPGDRGVHSHIAALLARALARTGPVHFVSESGLPDRPTHEHRDRLRLSTVLEVDQREDEAPAVIDGPIVRDLDVPQFLPGDARVVLAVREGTSARVVESAVAQFLPGELVGILFVPSRGPLARRFRPWSATQATADDEDAASDDELPQPSTFTSADTPDGGGSLAEPFRRAREDASLRSDGGDGDDGDEPREFRSSVGSSADDEDSWSDRRTSLVPGLGRPVPAAADAHPEIYAHVVDLVEPSEDVDQPARREGGGEPFTT